MMKIIYSISSAFVFSLLLLSCNTNEKTNNTPTNTTIEEKQTEGKKVVLFFGNSITAAYGLDPEYSFVHLIQQKIDSMKLDYTCVNAGNSGETTTGGLERLPWVLKKKVDVFVLELGANDALRGIEPEFSKENLKTMLRLYQETYPEGKILLLGMKAPPSMGVDYTNSFDPIYAELQKEFGCDFVPFVLAGVAGDKKLNLEDGIHPNKKGEVILTNTIWEVLAPML